MLDWSSQFSILCFLDSNAYPSVYDGYECLLAIGSEAAGNIDSLSALQAAHDASPDWYFGHIAYDYKNELESKLSSRHPVRIGFPVLQFFHPHTVCYINRECTLFTIETLSDPQAMYAAMIAQLPAKDDTALPQLHFTARVGKDEYLETIQQLRRHIADGDCYEINYCTEGYSENAVVEPLQVFRALNALSPAPFAAYYRLHDKYMMCASPERYMRKQDATLLSQPIKGTARRDADPRKDEQIKAELKADLKERAENVMITDLVRNDLARSCMVGSVQVAELFGIYTFPQVHQMISSITGTMCQPQAFTQAIRRSFPMGSMTGAPKHKVMQLTEQYEHSRRELYAGTIGYITPSGDFDLNVIIRSLFYNYTTRYLSYHTGGAITYDSDPIKEWEEMRLKAWALERVFS